jgi:hypothetical protein
MKRKLIYLFLFCSVLAFANPGTDLLSLLPDAYGYEGMAVIQEPSVYKGYDLFTMIDGGAEIYFEYGFQTALSTAYIKDDTRIELQLYEMSDKGAAAGMVTHSRITGDTIENIGESLVLNNETYSFFQKGNIFGIISCSQSSADMSHVYREMMMDILSRIESTGIYPDLLQKVLQAGYNFGDVKYIRGNIALASSYFSSHKDLFAMEDAVSIDADGIRYIIFSYPDSISPGSQIQVLKTKLSKGTGITNYLEKDSMIYYTDRRGRDIIIQKQGKYLVATIFTDGRADKSKLLPGGFNF